MSRPARAKAAIYKRSRSPFWMVRRTIPGLGEIRISTRTTNEKLAKRYDDLICELRELGRFDALAALKKGEISLHDLSTHREPKRLADLLAEKQSRVVTPLLKEWLEHGAADSDIRNSSMRRYNASWKHVWRLGILRDDARLSDINQVFVHRFKELRRAEANKAKKPLSPATINRDLAAIGAFLSWCIEEKECAVVRPRLKYQQESRGRTRWLSREELSLFRQKCPEQWWPLFGLLFGTGMTIGEALGLRVADFDLRECRASIHEEFGRKLKRASRARELSFPHSLHGAIAAHIAKTGNSPTDRVFPHTYWPARCAWAAICEAAKISGATIHDARHTFAVHAVLNGVPEARLQKLLGHSHPGTTRRYATHAPEQFVRQDAETISNSMGLDESQLSLDKSA
jgi:integrase